MDQAAGEQSLALRSARHLGDLGPAYGTRAAEHEPDLGVDVGARSEIYRILRGLAANGMALLIISSDLPEVLALSDRIVVMAEGRTVGELPGEGTTEEMVLRLATGNAASRAA